MSIEKPISTIRKAVHRLAEERAQKEGIDKPEQRHYDDVFLTYKAWRLLDPKYLEVAIKVTSKSQDLKNEMGTELFNIFDDAWINATKDGKNEMDKAIKQLDRTLNISQEEYKNELELIPERFLKEKTDQVKNDPKVTQAFFGKENLLEKALTTTASSIRELMAYEKGNSIS